MGLRAYLNRNPVVAGAGTVGVLLIALAITALSLRGPAGGGRADEHFYVDLTTEQIFVAPSASTPPESAAGNRAAYATVFSCDSCDAPETRFLGWATKSPPPRGIAGAAAISRDLQTWVSIDAPRAEQIRAVKCPDGSQPERCRP